MKRFCIVVFSLLSTFNTIHAQDTGTTRVKQNYHELPRFRVALQGGWSYRVAKIAGNTPANLRDNTKGLKSGYHLTADATYFFSSYMGCGLRYSYFHTGNELANVTAADRLGETKTGRLKDDINVHYIAPAFYLRYLPNNKLAFHLGLSVGYARYINNAMLADKFTLTAGAFATAFDWNMDYMITKHFGVGANLGLFVCDLTKYTLDNGVARQEVKLENENTEDLSRVDLSAGVRWKF